MKMNEKVNIILAEADVGPINQKVQEDSMNKEKF